jgi:hypothetical protein
MTSQIFDTIVVAFATLLAATIPYLWNYFAQRNSKKGQLYKLSYIKIIYLSRRGNGKHPIYKHFSKRLNKEIDIFDEFHYYRLNIFQEKQKDFSSYDRSSGTLDLMILHPWQTELVFDDLGAREVPNIIQQKLSPSQLFFTRTTYFNGFQEGNEDFSIKMETNTHEAKMIVDFSSIPNYQQIIKSMPQGKFRSGQTEHPVGVIESSGIYILNMEKLKKDDVLKLVFDIDWNKVDEISNNNGAAQALNVKTGNKPVER